LQFLTSDWSKERVKNWAAEVFDENVAEKFLAKEMTGVTLFSERITGVESMERLGLLMLRNQENFRSLVEQLKEIPFMDISKPKVENYISHVNITHNSEDTPPSVPFFTAILKASKRSKALTSDGSDGIKSGLYGGRNTTITPVA
ncbi:unnamed protein product, partial [Porites lobata]